MNYNGIYLRFWGYVELRRRKQLLLLLVLMVMASIGEVISIGAIVPFLGVLTAPEKVFSNEYAAPLIEYFGFSAPNELLLPLTIAFAAAALTSGMLRLFLLWSLTRLGHAIGADISFEMYRRTLYQPYSVHVSRNSSEVISGIAQKADEVVRSIVLPALRLASSIIMLVMIVATLVAIDPVVALTAFAGFWVIYLIVMLATKKQLVINSWRISQMATQRIKALQEGLGGIRDVLLDGTQPTYCKVYRKADLSLRRAQAGNQVMANSPRFGVEALGMVLIAVLAYALAADGDAIVSVIPVLGAMALGAQRLLPMLQQGYAGWSLIRGGRGSLSDALDLLGQPLPALADTPKPAPMPFQSEIQMSGLGFRYDPDAPSVLSDLELTIPRGARIGLVGTTGSGKSTLLDIFMGLLVPTEGKLLIDGVPVDQENQRAWQGHIAHVPQVIFLADASISENIAFGVPPDQIDHERVRLAAKQAQISETIEGWDEQYDRLVGERGERLSGGQRQRIGIARALYKHADVIVFDEATSALDNDTERSVMGAIDGIGREITILVVAHRLSTLKGCDLVVELERGKVKRQGSYDEMVLASNKQVV